MTANILSKYVPHCGELKTCVRNNAQLLPHQILPNQKKYVLYFSLKGQLAVTQILNQVDPKK